MLKYDEAFLGRKRRQDVEVFRRFGNHLWGKLVPETSEYIYTVTWLTSLVDFNEFYRR